MGSRAEHGSSIKSSFGSSMSERAMQRRCLLPARELQGRLFSRSFYFVVNSRDHKLSTASSTISCLLSL
jgi:hypothetical protein